MAETSRRRWVVRDPRKQAEQTQQLLLNELKHRIKNTLASVQAIVQHTLRSTKDPAAFVDTFAGRIQSLARVHSLLTETSWKEADLCDLIHDQLLQGAVDETRITAWGPTVCLEAQMSLRLALVLHELGTNAHKYGALSAPSGWVTIGWTVEGELLRFRWQERGGPAVTSRTRPGFGTTLIEQSIKGEGGSARKSVGAGGVRWEITLPLPGPTATSGSTSRLPRMIRCGQFFRRTHGPDILRHPARASLDSGRKAALNGVFTAYENVCPYMGGPVCRGDHARVEERIAADKTSLGRAFSKDQENIVCPWHGYEFDIATGRHQGNPRMRLTPVEIAVLDGDLVVTLLEGTRERIMRRRSGVDQEDRAR